MSAKKILIIEDNPANLKLASDILTAEGYEVLKATEGMAGLEILKQRHDQISLVLLDLKLPDMDGIEIIKKIKAGPDTRKIPVIVVSAHAMESDIKSSKEAGCADYITKPINIKGFLDRVSSVV